MKTARVIGIASLIIWIIIHFISREYCYCCVRMCGIYTTNVWDYLYTVSVMGGVCSFLFILSCKWPVEKQDNNK